MDPVSIVGLAASTAQLAGLAKDTFTAIFKYVGEVKDAPKHARDLRNELLAVCDLVDSLDNALNVSSTTSSFNPPASLASAIAEFRGILETIKDRITEVKTRGVRRLTWPFTKGQTEKHLTRIGRYKETFNMALNIKDSYEVKVIVDAVLLEKQHKILDWISSSNAHSRQEELRKTRVANSGQWFIAMQEYIDWINGSGPSCLICTGNPGAGKSVLMSIAVDDLIERCSSGNSTVVSIYFDYKSQMTQTANDIAEKILRQLLGVLDTIPPKLESLYDSCTRTNARAELSDLKRILLLCIHNFSSVYVVFDALDECDDSHRREILTFVSQLQKWGCRILMSSRPHLRNSLEEQLDDTLIIETKADEQDVRNYISCKLDQCGNNNPEVEQRCLNLAAGVQGVFLLARFQVDHILGHREPRKRLKAFKTIPKDMPAAYDDVIQRIEKSSGGNDKDLVFRVLAWILLASRPLTVEELLEALAVGAEDDGSDNDFEEEDQDLYRQKLSHDNVRDNMLRPLQLIECCKSLVECEETSGLVRFVHYTVQEYVCRQLQDKMPTDAYLAKTCLSYLTLQEFDQSLFDWEELNKLVKTYRFLSYAEEFWVTHTRASEDDRAVQKAVLTFLASENCLRWRLQHPRTLDIVADGQTVLHLVAYYGLTRITELLVGGSTRKRDSDKDFRRLLDLLKTDVNKQDSMGRTPLMLAALESEDKVVEILLQSGADVGLVDLHEDTALHRAVGSLEDERTARLLGTGKMASLQTVTRHDRYGRPVHFGVRNRFEEVVALLLDLKAVRDKNTGQDIALHFATYHGNDKVIKLLLDAGADVTKRNVEGQTVLDIIQEKSPRFTSDNRITITLVPEKQIVRHRGGFDTSV